MATTIHQHGDGDNIAGDKIGGDKIGTQITGSNVGNAVNTANDNAQISATNISQTSGATPDDLLRLVASLRQHVAQLPADVQEDLIIDIDDVEAEVKKPADERNQLRLKKRLAALLTAVTVGATGLAGGLEVTNTIADEVIELSEKVGIELPLPPTP